MRGQHIAQLPFVGLCEAGNSRLLVLVALVENHVPVGQSFQVSGSEQIARPQLLKVLDRFGQLALFREQVPKRQFPRTGHGVISLDPLAQHCHEFVRSIERDQQPVLVLFPSGRGFVVEAHSLVNVRQQSLDQLRPGFAASRKVCQRHQESPQQRFLQRVSEGTTRIDPRWCGTNRLPTSLLDLVEIRGKNHLHVCPLRGHPGDHQLRGVAHPLLQSLGVRSPGLFQVLQLFVAQLGARQFGLVSDLSHQSLEA